MDPKLKAVDTMAESLERKSKLKNFSSKKNPQNGNINLEVQKKRLLRRVIQV